MAGSTIKDVARLAGVSTATVSRVINGNYFVSPEIEKKVRDAIEELNYYPNSVARSLKSDNTYMIGMLVSDISNSYFTSLARAVEDKVREQNYNLIVCSTEESKDQELNYLRLLSGKKIDGLILNTTGKNDEFVTSLSVSIPMVLINRRIYNTAFAGDFIDSNNLDGVYELTSSLISHGHKKIGVINGELTLSTGKERFEGFTEAMRQIGIRAEEGYTYRYDGNFSMESGYQGAAWLMELSEPPTGIVVMNNSMAVGALKYFKAKGIRVPEDVSIAAFGNIDNMDVLFVQPAIVTSNPRSVGSRAGSMIMERIQDRSIKNREVIFSPQLIPGNSIRHI